MSATALKNPTPLPDGFVKKPLVFSTVLTRVLPPAVAEPLKAFGLETAEDLYECVAATGATWFRPITGIDSTMATALMVWLLTYGEAVGEVTARFFLPGHVPEALARAALAEEAEEVTVLDADEQRSRPRAAPRLDGSASEDRLEASLGAVVPLESLILPEALNGERGINRAPEGTCSLSAKNDLEAVNAWLAIRATNPNTHGNYRKEVERFLLWCLVERRTALSSIKAGDAALYLRWLEQLGRTDEAAWQSAWREPQSRWIGPKNVPRLSPAWRPFNGPLMSTSRRNAMTVVRLLFNFLTKTGYLVFNPFDQVSTKVPLLKGEGIPQAFADRSLTEAQWEEITSHLTLLPEGWPRSRMKLILMMGKSLGMRASEMLDARAAWIVERRIGLKTHAAIEIVGKGAKVRRLPLTAEQRHIIDEALAARDLPPLGVVDAETPLLINLGRGRNPHGAMTRSGLYRVLEAFFELVAREIESTRPMDAAKLRASSTHWLRHTFAVNALAQMDVNVVQHAMGHASVATTGRYLAPEEETLTAAMEKMKAL